MFHKPILYDFFSLITKQLYSINYEILKFFLSASLAWTNTFTHIKFSFVTSPDHFIIYLNETKYWKNWIFFFYVCHSNCLYILTNVRTARCWKINFNVICIFEHTKKNKLIFMKSFVLSFNIKNLYIFIYTHIF